MSGALRIVQRNALVYRRAWRGSVFSSFLQPTMFLTAMGWGLGTFVDRGTAALPGGVPFLHFLAPGLLAAACMQNAAFESSFPVMDKMTWRRTYEAIAATPIRVADIVVGELAWMAIRLSTIAVAFLLVLTAFGVPRTPKALLAIPAAVLTGLAFAAIITAYAATLRNSNSFNAVFRFGITPLFLFSGVFFPLDSLPAWLRAIAWLTPLFHGVELVRGLMLDSIETGPALVHVAYLTVMVLIGLGAGVRTFTRTLHG
jgi:lipooligosaccharide transport system permease protein